MIWVEQPRSSRVAFILPGGCNLALNQFPTHTNDNKTKKKKIELQEKPTLSRDGGFSFLVFNNHIENDKRIRKTKKKKKKKKYNKTLFVLPKGPDAHRQQLQVALQRTVFNVMNLQVREPSV